MIVFRPAAGILCVRLGKLEGGGLSKVRIGGPRQGRDRVLLESGFRIEQALLVCKSLLVLGSDELRWNGCVVLREVRVEGWIREIGRAHV